jgi:DNA-binding NtrC family response regulator
MPTSPPVQTEVQTQFQPYAAEVLAGGSEAAARLRLQVTRIAPHFRTALVTGERGVGKETVARELHRLSRSGGYAGPFSTIELSAFAESWEPVDLRGVLFLKGLDRLDPTLQEKLVERLRSIQRQTRVIVSSEFELRAMLAAGRLRQSLASRVGGLEIRVGPLRDRMEDFSSLAASMLSRLNTSASFGTESLRILHAHSWPGNLRELWRVVEQVSSVEGVILPKHLPELAAAETPDESGTRLDRVMQRHVFEVLQRCAGNKLKAAEMLGISRSTLYRMLEAASE